MKQYIIFTKSESGDDYSYALETKQDLTDEFLRDFLLEYGNDIGYEEIVLVHEIEEFIVI